MKRCLSVAEFADFLSGDSTHEQHVRACARCKAIVKALSYADVVSDLEGVLAETERRTTGVAAAVAALESARPHQWPTIVSSDVRLHGPEGVRRLLDRAAASYTTMPRRSLALAKLALECCDRGDVAPSVRFDALKDVAKFSLRAADDLSGALAALDEAEKLVPATDAPEYFAAVLAHTRAYIYGDSTAAQWGQALDLLGLSFRHATSGDGERRATSGQPSFSEALHTIVPPSCTEGFGKASPTRTHARCSAATWPNAI